MADLRNLAEHEYKLIGDIIGDSFSDDPINEWVFGPQAGITHYYQRVAKKLYLKQGYGHVMADQSGGSLWLPPGVNKEIPLYNSLDIAAAMIKYNGPGSILKGMSVDALLEKKHPKAPHYYLFAIGARQGMQGKGIGGRLMVEGLKPVDEAKLPAFLESSKELNVPFYQRYGFEVIEKCTPAKGCPPMWLMWREAR